MTPNLARYINKTVFVSIPTLFDDGECRPYTLMGVEISGLWLQSKELTDRLLSDEDMGLAELDPVAFVPFAQIAGVVIATSLPGARPNPDPKPNRPTAAQPTQSPTKASRRGSRAR